MNCQAITKKGIQCSRDTIDDLRFCWQHQNETIVDNKNLTDKQRVFCEEYIIDNNATRAAIAAGYSEGTSDVQGSRLLKNVKVAKEINKLQEARSQRTEITADRVIKELAKIGFVDIKDYLSFGTEKVKAGTDNSGQPIHEYQTVVQLKDSEEVEGKAISEVQLKDGALKFKLHDKMKALEDIGRHLGMFNDKIDITSNGKDISSMTVVEREKRKQELREKLGDS